MKVRTLLTIVLMLAGVLGVALLFDANHDVLSAPFQFWPGVEVPVGYTLVGFLIAGMAIAFLAGAARELGLLVERRRRKKLGKKLEAIEEEYSRGLSAVLEGREAEALGHFRAVLEQDSRHFNTLLKIGEVLRSQGRVAEAIEYHRKAHHLKEEDTRPLYALVEDYESKGDMDRARAVLGKIISINKSSISAWRRLRALHVKEREWERALEAHQQAQKLAPRAGEPLRDEDRTGVGIRFEIASSALEAGRAKDAASMLRKLLKDEPRFIPAHVRLGEALRSLGRENDAVEAWHRAFEITGSPIFLTLLEEHHLAREQPLDAIEALKRCIGAARKDTIARFYLGKLYFRLEMLDDALSVLTSLEGRASYAPNLHYLLGRIHERRGKPAEAVKRYRAVIKEMDLVHLEYRCEACDETLVEWAARCPACARWDSIEINFREELSLEELGISSAPIYTSGT